MKLFETVGLNPNSVDIRRKSIRNKLIKGFSALGVVMVIMLVIVLVQSASIVKDGYQVLGSNQPVKMHTYALMSGIQHTAVALQVGTTDPKADFAKKAEEVWQKEVSPFADSIRLNAEKWDESEKKQIALDLLTKVNDLHATIGSADSFTQTVELSEATIAEATIATSVNDSVKTVDASSPGVVQDAIRMSYNPQLAGFLQDKFSPAQQEIVLQAATLLKVNQQVIDQFEIGVGEKVAGIKVSVILIILSILATIAIIIQQILKRVRDNISALNSHIAKLAEGMIPEAVSKSDAELDIITDSVNLLTTNLKAIKEFAQHVGQGNFDNDIKVFNDAGELGNSLASMRDGLKQVSEQDKIRYWTNEGLAKFGNILRENDKDLKQLSDCLITNLVKYLKANQGGVFVVNSEDKQRPFMTLTACYAYERKKFVEKEVLPGQGLLGQVWQEAQTIYLRDIPKAYVRITSGLGGSNPRYLLIVPLKLNGQVHGVIELASFHDFEKHMIDFAEKIAESIASSIAGTRVTEQTRYLLEEAQSMAEEMRAQEEEMRQNMEELQATQEEMYRSQRETAEQLASVQMEKDALQKKLEELESK
jgi:hypothetical protein